MNYNSIKSYELVNDTNKKIVDELVSSMLTNGWVGAPILIENDRLVTGSHRLNALKEIERKMNNEEIEDDAFDFDSVGIEDVTEILAEYWENNPEEAEESDYTIDYTNLGKYFENTAIEAYKDGIVEW